jgi:hypothetical protein
MKKMNEAMLTETKRAKRIIRMPKKQRKNPKAKNSVAEIAEKREMIAHSPNTSTGHQVALLITKVVVPGF